MSALAVAALFVAAPRVAWARPAGDATSAAPAAACQRFAEPCSHSHALDETRVVAVDSAPATDLCANRSRNPNFPAAFVFESHSASCLAWNRGTPGTRAHAAQPSFELSAPPAERCAVPA